MEGFDVVVKFDLNKLSYDDTNIFTSLNDIIHQTDETGEFEIGNLHITINSTKDRSYELIKINNE